MSIKSNIIKLILKFARASREKVTLRSMMRLHFMSKEELEKLLLSYLARR